MHCGRAPPLAIRMSTLRDWREHVVSLRRLQQGSHLFCPRNEFHRELIARQQPCKVIGPQVASLEFAMGAQGRGRQRNDAEWSPPSMLICTSNPIECLFARSVIERCGQGIRICDYREVDGVQARHRGRENLAAI
jgi:hypothetical protein